ncbi:primosomal protein DnaI [Virgibacillus sp. W0430]|uniref:primosomal protein DnaI n=1 Tax=Virgibacillus sp. W0430 TaxID=3391580 RepID=UPI003F485538
MESIQSTLKSWIQKNPQFKDRLQNIQQDILKHPDVLQFLSEHPELTEQTVTKHLIKLHEYVSQSKQCKQCASYSECKNMLKGYSPILRVENGEIRLAYEKCSNHIAHEQIAEQQNLIKSLYMPKEILEASIEKIEFDQGRSQAIREISYFLDQAKTQLPAKGLYITGPFGVGKTYFLGAIANKLKEFHIPTMIIYMPEFVREIKNAFKDDSVNEKINYFKTTQVLMIDDIGAEMQSAWFRDEVLGSILQYRMMERLPVFFTSNYTLDQLEIELATTRGGVEEVKAGRIIERIKQVSKEIPLYGENRRETPPSV